MTGKHIGLLGGAFDPPHFAHLAVAEAAQKQYSLDRIVFMPVAVPPLKFSPGIAPETDRMAMVQAAIAGHPAWMCSDLEIRRGGPSYTVDTLEALRVENPGAEFSLLIGSDNFATFGHWKEPGRIAQMAQILVYARPGYRLTPEAAEALRCAGIPVRAGAIEGAAMNVSSSDIRRLLREQKDVSELVPGKVLAYIRQHQLYGAARDSNRRS